MNILISGFGNIGCRHAQSLLTSSDDFKLFVIEPSDKSFESGLSIIGASKDDFIRFRSINELNSEIDLAISATCSEPRFGIIMDLIEYGIKYFLVEKIAFQSMAQFDNIIEMLAANKAVAYCHSPNRYYKNFIDLKSVIKNNNDYVKLNVFGGNNGIGCNGIHFLDLFEFLTGSIICKSSALMRHDKSFKSRGPNYTDVNGLFILKNENEDQLIIYFDPMYRAGITTYIEVGDEKYIFSPRDRKEHRYKKNEIRSRDFEVLFSSKLTEIIVKDILNGNTYLSTLEQSRNAYGFLLKEITRALGKKFNNDVKCPIT